MIDRLEDAGHVERRRDPADRRAWQIFLTDKSRPLLDKLGVIAGGLFDDALAGIDEDRRRELSATLDAIRHNLTAPDIQDQANG
jgi:DNA-binding MarR family transcriptional regulator